VSALEMVTGTLSSVVWGKIRLDRGRALTLTSLCAHITFIAICWCKALKMTKT
jgi:hypothetical protein